MAMAKARRKDVLIDLQMIPAGRGGAGLGKFRAAAAAESYRPDRGKSSKVRGWAAVYNPFPFSTGCAAVDRWQRPPGVNPGVRLRLTGGQGRGRRVAAAALRGLRPTSARVREALFDILGARVDGAAFLDLFAGTGAVGLEALSRGAGRVVFVEADGRAARLIAGNVRAAGLPGAVTLIEHEATRALERLAAAGDAFSIVFLDPPYAAGAPPAILDRSAALVAAGGVLVIEHGGHGAAAIDTPAGLRAGRRYRYGDSRLSVFHRDPPSTGQRG